MPASQTSETHALPPHWRRALLLMAMAVGLALVASTDQLHGRLLVLFAQAEGFIRMQPGLGLLVFLAFAATSAMLAFVSSAVIVPVGIMVWGQTETALLLWAGWILGGMGSYALSRYVGRPVVKKLMKGETLERYESRISERTPFAVVVLFQMAVPSELPGYLLGMARYRFWKYALALAIGEVPYAIGTVYLGNSFMEQRAIPLIAVGLGGAAFGGWAIYTLHRKFASERGAGQVK